jgi:hypothetical protein
MVGCGTLCITYNRLFSISIDKDASISNVVEGVGVDLVWKGGWRRELFSYEKDSFNAMLQELQASTFQVYVPDEWKWLVESSGKYSVRSAYAILSNVETQVVDPFFEKIWKSHVPSKVQAFVWQVAKDRIP